MEGKPHTVATCLFMAGKGVRQAGITTIALEVVGSGPTKIALEPGRTGRPSQAGKDDKSGYPEHDAGYRRTAAYWLIRALKENSVEQKQRCVELGLKWLVGDDEFIRLERCHDWSGHSMATIKYPEHD